MKAWQLLEKPEAWTKGWFARNAGGKDVKSSSPGACCWCILGAIEKCYPLPSEFTEACNKVRSRVQEISFHYWLDHWNDAETTTHSQVLEVLKACDV